MGSLSTLILFGSIFNALCQEVDEAPHDCPGGPVAYAGGSSEFQSPNANVTCEAADMLFPDTGWNEKFTVEQAEPVCTDYPLVRISLPADTPLGTAKMTWQCNNDEPNPCQLILVKSMTMSESATITAFAMSQECPLNDEMETASIQSDASSVLTMSVGQGESQSTLTDGGSGYGNRRTTTPLDQQPTTDAGQVDTARADPAATDPAATDPAVTNPAATDPTEIDPTVSSAGTIIPTVLPDTTSLTDPNSLPTQSIASQAQTTVQTGLVVTPNSNTIHGDRATTTSVHFGNHPSSHVVDNDPSANRECTCPP